MTLETVKTRQTHPYWHAVVERNGELDGVFVYAIRSTGIYCRPSCPARNPKRENVTFFGTPECAQRQGYRACKRCQPDSVEASPQVVFVREVCRYIETNVEQPLTLQRLGEHFVVSPSHLQRTFKKIVGVSPQAYLETHRLNTVKAALQQGDDISGATYAAGYGSGSRLYAKADAHLGMTPKTYREKGHATLIRYTITDSPLGKILVAATDKGICSVRLGDDATALEKELHSEFAQAETKKDDDALTEWVNAILHHLSGQEPHLDLPLDVRATAFQKQVWQALQQVPYGETRSYAELAEAIGRPKAVRATASACARNPVALVVPCHRIVRSGGGLGGYRWGVGRKEALLEQEAKSRLLEP